MIKLTEKYFLDFDKLCFILCERKINQKKVIVGKDESGNDVTVEGKNYGKEYFENDSYYGKLSQLISRLCELKLKSCDAKTLQELKDAHAKIEMSIIPVDDLIKALRDEICDLKNENNYLKAKLEARE